MSIEAGEAGLHDRIAAVPGAFALTMAGLRDHRRARTAVLDRLERAGRALDIEDIVRVMIEVETIGTGDPEQISSPPIGFGHMRFVAAMQLNYRDKFMATIGDRWDTSYLRCVRHIKALLPGVPEATLNQRLVYFYVFVNASLATREAAFMVDRRGGNLWGDARALENLIEVLAAGLRGGVRQPNKANLGPLRGSNSVSNSPITLISEKGRESDRTK